MFLERLKQSQKDSQAKEPPKETTAVVTIPKPLRKNIFTIAGAAFSLFILAIIFLTINGINGVCIAGVVLSIAIAVYGYFLYRKFRNRKYTTIDGLCTDAQVKGILRHKSWQITIEDINSKDIYSFSSPFSKRHRILPGDRIYLYLPQDNLVVENDGILDVLSYYGYEIHR